MGMDSLLLTLHVVTNGGAGSDVPVWQRVVAYGDRLAAFSHAHSAIDPLDDFSGVTAHPRMSKEEAEQIYRAAWTRSGPAGTSRVPGEHAFRGQI
jgi:hypothetical protein